MHFRLAVNYTYLGFMPSIAFSRTLGGRKVLKTFPKSARYTLEDQKRPKMLPMGSSTSLKRA